MSSQNEAMAPDGWKTCKLGEIAFLKNGFAFKSNSYIGTGIPVIRISDINDGCVLPENAKKVEADIAFNDYSISDRDILIAMSGATTGKFGIYKSTTRAYQNQRVGNLLPISEKDSDKSFLYYLLHSLKRTIEKNAYGGAQPNISSKQIESFEIVLPPLNEQHRIVAKIEELFSELDKGIESLKTARKQLKVYRQALLKHAFEGKLTEQWRKDNIDKLETADDVQGCTNAAGAGSAGAAQLLERIKQEREARYQQQLEEWKAAVKQWEADGKEGKKPSKPQKHKTVDGISSEEYSRLPGVPKEWGYIRFGEVIDTIDAGKSFKCDEREPLDSEVGVAKVSAVTWGEYDQSESKTCLDPEKVVSEYFIREGDFIMSRANTIELVGAAVIVRHVSKSVMLSDKTLRISMDNSLKPFALHYLRSRTGRKEIMSRSTGNQESMRNIGQDRIRSICLPICSEIEIGKIIDLLDEKLSVVDEQIQDIEVSLSKSEALRQSILKKAFSGQLVSQDPNDEPASFLLDRIAKEKEEAAAEAKKAKAAKKKSVTRKAS